MVGGGGGLDGGESDAGCRDDDCDNVGFYQV